MTVYSRSQPVPSDPPGARRSWAAGPGGPAAADPWAAPEPPPQRAAKLLLVPFLAGCAVAITLGVYGSVHTGTGVAVNLAGFSGPVPAKVWLTMASFTFAVVQVVSAFVMYRSGSAGAGTVHRWSGRIAFLLAVPVAVHCLYAQGFADFNARVLIHSLLGCVFFGAFTVKMLGLRRPGLPGWVLPVLGGVTFALLVGVWWTSSLWFFYYFGFEF